jgi:hypothetical protein
VKAFGKEGLLLVRLDQSFNSKIDFSAYLSEYKIKNLTGKIDGFQISVSILHKKQQCHPWHND